MILGNTTFTKQFILFFLFFFFYSFLLANNLHLSSFISEINNPLIQGKIFHDLNLDGVNNDLIGGLSDVKVDLLDSEKNIVASTYTDQSGSYYFLDISNKEEYSLEIELNEYIHQAYDFIKPSINESTLDIGVKMEREKSIPPGNVSILVCDLIIDEVKVSECYLDNSGDSKSTVSLEFSWIDAPMSNDEINVSIGNQSASISMLNPVQREDGSFSGDIQPLISPQVISFEFDADGSTQNINISFDSNASCFDMGSVTLPSSCEPLICSNNEEIEGSIYADNNADGILTAGEVVRFEGIDVYLFGTDGSGNSILLDQTVSDKYGNYIFYNLTNGAEYRVEFHVPNELSVINDVYSGSSNGTNVSFVEAPACNINYGLLDPRDFGSDSIQVFTPCYLNGDRTHPSVADQEALVFFDYDAEDLPVDNGKTVSGCSINKP